MAALAGGTGRFRYGVVTAFTPRMTAANSFQRQPGAAHRAVLPHRFKGVGRTGGLEPAPATRTAERAQQRGQRHPVNPNEQRQDVLGQIHARAPSSACPRSAARKSRSTSASALPAIDGRATSTKSIVRRNSC